MLLIPPVLLELGSTGWRFACYYAGDREYVRRGPPLWPLRLMAPLVVAATLAVFATGVALLFTGRHAGFVVLLHKASFIVWFAVTAIHVLAHLRPLPGLVAADWRRRPMPPESRIPGTPWRRLLLAGSIVAGAILAIATVHYARSVSSWSNSGSRSRSSPPALSPARSGTTTLSAPPRTKPIRSGPRSSGS